MPGKLLYQLGPFVLWDDILPDPARALLLPRLDLPVEPRLLAGPDPARLDRHVRALTTRAVAGVTEVDRIAEAVGEALAFGEAVLDRASAAALVEVLEALDGRRGRG